MNTLNTINNINTIESTDSAEQVSQPVKVVKSSVDRKAELLKKLDESKQLVVNVSSKTVEQPLQTNTQVESNDGFTVDKKTAYKAKKQADKDSKPIVQYTEEEKAAYKAKKLAEKTLKPTVQYTEAEKAAYKAKKQDEKSTPSSFKYTKEQVIAYKAKLATQKEHYGNKNTPSSFKYTKEEVIAHKAKLAAQKEHYENKNTAMLKGQDELIKKLLPSADIQSKIELNKKYTVGEHATTYDVKFSSDEYPVVFSEETYNFSVSQYFENRTFLFHARNAIRDLFSEGDDIFIKIGQNKRGGKENVYFVMIKFNQ